jgi:hypothetical protein
VGTEDAPPVVIAVTERGLIAVAGGLPQRSLACHDPLQVAQQVQGLEPAAVDVQVEDFGAERPEDRTAPGAFGPFRFLGPLAHFLMLPPLLFGYHPSHNDP